MAELVGALSYTPKGCWFNPCSNIGGNWSMLLYHFSLSLSLFHFFSLEKYILRWVFFLKLYHVYFPLPTSHILLPLTKLLLQWHLAMCYLTTVQLRALLAKALKLAQPHTWSSCSAIYSQNNKVQELINLCLYNIMVTVKIKLWAQTCVIWYLATCAPSMT